MKQDKGIISNSFKEISQKFSHNSNKFVEILVKLAAVVVILQSFILLGLLIDNITTNTQHLVSPIEAFMNGVLSSVAIYGGILLFRLKKLGFMLTIITQLIALATAHHFAFFASTLIIIIALYGFKKLFTDVSNQKLSDLLKLIGLVEIFSGALNILAGGHSYFPALENHFILALVLGFTILYIIEIAAGIGLYLDKPFGYTLSLLIQVLHIPILFTRYLTYSFPSIIWLQQYFSYDNLRGYLGIQFIYPWQTGAYGLNFLNENLNQSIISFDYISVFFAVILVRKLLKKQEGANSIKKETLTNPLTLRIVYIASSLILLLPLYLMSNHYLLKSYPAGIAPTEVTIVNDKIMHSIGQQCRFNYSVLDMNAAIAIHCGDYWPFIHGWLLNKSQYEQWAQKHLPVDYELFVKQNFSKLNLNFMILSGMDLRGFDFTDATTVGTVFTNSNLVNSNISNDQLKSASSICNAKLPDGTIGDCFHSAALMNTSLQNQNFEGFSFTGLHYQLGKNEDFMKTTFENSNLTGSNFRNSKLIGDNLRNANFSYVDLTNADLTDANTDGTDFTGANLTSAKISEEQLKQASSICNAILPNGEKGGCHS